MDSIYVVNNYVQSGGMGIFQNLNVLFSFLLTLFAGGMFWNARAHLKNATVMRELEEINCKIALWREIKKIHKAVDKFTNDVIVGNLSEIPDHDFDYSSAVQFASVYFEKDDEILPHLEKLKNNGLDLYVVRMELLEVTESSQKKKAVSKLYEMEKSLRNKSKEIREILQSRYNLAIATPA